MHPSLTAWFNDACKPFARFTAEQVLEMDTNYDVDDLYLAFKRFAASQGLNANAMTYHIFCHEVAKRCKPRPRRFMTDSDNDDDYY